jgi:hypothetical protein
MVKSRLLIFIVSFIMFSISAYALDSPGSSLCLNINTIQKLTGQIGQVDKERRTYKIIIPQNELKVLISGMPMTSEMGLSSWIVFKKTAYQTFLNGDLVLLQDQINPVMSTALLNGLQVTGLHNPYLWDSPRVMFMHIKGEGDETHLASAIRQILNKIKATSNGAGDFPLGEDASIPETTLNGSKIEAILGQKGRLENNVYKIEFIHGIKNPDTTTNQAIAINTWAAFSGSDKEAIVNGTVALRESELQKTLFALRNAKIYILAIYRNRMDEDDQELVWVNFWGIGGAQNLAKTLHSVFLFSNDNTRPEEATFSMRSALGRETKTELIPLQLSLFQNNICGYVKEKELYTSIDTKQNIPMTYPQSPWNLALHTALKSTQKVMSEEIMQFIQFFPALMRMAQSINDTQIKPLTHIILSTLTLKTEAELTSFVNTIRQSDASMAVVEGGPQATKAPLRNIFAPSAMRLLTTLSVIEKNNNIDILSISNGYIYPYLRQFTMSSIRNTSLGIHGFLTYLSDTIAAMTKHINTLTTAYASKTYSLVNILSADFSNAATSLSQLRTTVVSLTQTYMKNFGLLLAQSLSLPMNRDAESFPLFRSTLFSSPVIAAFAPLLKKPPLQLAVGSPSPKYPPSDLSSPRGWYV